MRFLLEIAYDGTAYHGSQRQPNGLSVQEVLENALGTILRQPVTTTFAGRTDAGVHAKQMFVHFDWEGEAASFGQHTLANRLNALLPPDIAVYDCLPVADTMHARFSARSRTYEYHVTERKDPFAVHHAARVALGLDYAKMNDAAKELLGRHDFASFCKVHTDVKTTFCTVTEAYWQNQVFTITADRFLRNMVRAIVGTILDVGRGMLTIEQFREIIEKKDRCSAGTSVPGNALFLADITYPEDVFLEHEPLDRRSQ